MRRIIALFAALFLTMMIVAPANAGGNKNDKQTICHATASFGNPYVQITPNKNGDVSGHADHTGPVFDGVNKGWGDIIPPFTYNDHGTEKSLPGLNWTAEGQEIFNDGCNVPVKEEPSPTPTVQPTPTEQPTVTPTDVPTDAPTDVPTTGPECPDGTVLSAGGGCYPCKDFNSDTGVCVDDTKTDNPNNDKHKPQVVKHVAQPVPTAVAAGVQSLPNTGGPWEAVGFVGVLLLLAGAGFFTYSRLDKGKHTN